ncbi:MAG: hypothetical protein Kow0059_04570 [Candidatus Sumerlaeia bacterium]
MAKYEFLNKAVVMNRIEKKRLQEHARIIKAMAHPTRLFIIEELQRGERCVCDLQALIQSDMSTVSRHLSILKNAGLIQDERRGVQIFYSLRVPCVLNFLGCVDAVLEANRKSHLELVS